MEKQTRPRVLIVDDDPVILRGLADALGRAGCDAKVAASGQEAMEAYAKHPYDLVLLDVRLPDMGGLEILSRILGQDDDQLVIVMTAYADAAVAVQAMKSGAYDYIHKPFDLEELKVLISKAMETRRMKGEIEALRHKYHGDIPAHEIIGSSRAMWRIRALVRKVSATPRTSVLIQGESGTGKERVANAIHFQSSRRDFPLLKINCSAIPHHLMESELFGYERGAFTDAKGSKKGLLEMANGGTVFLDEVGDLHPSLQPKLLRFLETHSLQRLGGLREIQVDVRIVAATHRDLRAMVQEGAFREDLYYRLKVMFLEIPPLRERKEDILLLAHYFLQEISRDLGKPLKDLPKEAEERLLQYPWPGNARELRNVLERAAILSSTGTIRAEHLKLDTPVRPPLDSATYGLPSSLEEDLSLERLEREHIARVLQLVGGNKSEAARRLGISRSTLQERLRAYRIKGPQR